MDVLTLLIAVVVSWVYACVSPVPFKYGQFIHVNYMSIKPLKIIIINLSNGNITDFDEITVMS